jgi:hypothetical protein
MKPRPTIARDQQAPPDAEQPSIEKLAAIVVEMQEDIASLRRRVDRRPPRPPSIANGWVVLKDAAFRTGYAAESIRLWAASGKVIAMRCGAKWYVNLASLKKQVNSVQDAVRERAKFR